MDKTPTISIYNASAGAGKTFTLVRNYLVILFSSKNIFKYRQILAITFTNKAVAEMKTRIVENLKRFAHPQNEDDTMFNEVMRATGLSREELNKKAAILLKNIVQDYASFDVVTIDAFTQRIIRTFARDLKIPQQFEVELNTQEVLEQAVDNLIARAGEDPDVTSVLLNYAIEKIDADKSWDISKDLYDIAKLLTNENNRLYLELLKNKSLTDFTNLKKRLHKNISSIMGSVSALAQESLQLIASHDLDKSHFTRGTLPNHLNHLSADEFSKFDLSAAWVINIESAPLYTKSQKDDIKSTIDQIAPQLVQNVTKIKVFMRKMRLYEEILKKVTPLSVLQAIRLEVEKIKTDKNLVLISDFNETIHKNIVGQPTPFIYERLGERYQHYFIDEFQDTSILQWENLIPLIDNTVSTLLTDEENGLMLVGDPKQSIYRWRGGCAEQFIKLSTGHNPFQNQDKKTLNLENNWRSYDEVIHFNNAFFNHCARYLENPVYAQLFSNGCQQKTNSKQGGYISISFVEGKTKEETTPLFLEQTHSKINQALDQGFKYQDITILVRKNTEGMEIARFLQEHHIPVISNESLLLAQSKEVQFIVNILLFLQNPEANAITILILEYLAQEYYPQEDPHSFYVEHLPYTGQKLFEKLKNKKIDFNLNHCLKLPLYESVEYIIRAFNLQNKGGAYLQYFLDAVYNFIQKDKAGLSGFLDWWERNKNKASISTSPAMNAIEIMTVHKSKGLEFPVVIYPFADSLIQASDSTWHLTDPEEFEGFEALQLSHKTDLMHLGEDTAALYQKIVEQQQLDSLNILYVALTRAVEQLYIISSYKPKSKSNSSPKNYGDLLVSYLENLTLWDNQKKEFEFGLRQRKSDPVKQVQAATELNLISVSKESHNIAIITPKEYLMEDMRVEALQMGNTMHDIMAQVKIEGDLYAAIDKAEQAGLILAKDINLYKIQLDSLVQSLKKAGFFDPKKHVYAERDVIYKGTMIRPDRVEVDSNNQVYLLDYKTGAPSPDHLAQIDYYASALNAMGLKVVKKVIAYLNEQNPVVEVN